MGYRFPKATMDDLLNMGKILFGKDENKIIELKLYAKDYVDKLPSVITMDSRLGIYDIREVIPEEVKSFDNPKPVDLIKLLLSYCTKEEDIILDSFAGSGTTGQAVLELNKDDGGKRRFILVELEDHIAKKVAAKRLKRVVEGYGSQQYPHGTGQGFQYLDINGELYNRSGFVNPDADFGDMAAYIFFTETGRYLDETLINNPYIGTQRNTHYFLFFKSRGGNILDENALKKTQDREGKKVIYADKNFIDEEFLVKQGITFKQIPYELKKY